MLNRPVKTTPGQFSILTLSEAQSRREENALFSSVRGHGLTEAIRGLTLLWPTPATEKLVDQLCTLPKRKHGVRTDDFERPSTQW